MSKSLTLGSFFDGIGGWLLAAKHAGVNPVWASEIDDFPATVSAHHFPQVKQLGDITKINVDELEPTDIICAGSPCQDLSVAGKREGLTGERSGLFRTAIKLVHRLRASTGKPRFFVWENVPGAFSSNKRQDFRAVLEEIGQAAIPMPRSGRWADAGMVRTEAADICWRVLDAQYWGVPQRRKRIFLVADFAAANRCAGEILFECESVRGDSAESEGAREGAANGTAVGVGTPDVYDMTHANEVMRLVTGGVTNTLNSSMGTGGNQVSVLHYYTIAGNTIGRTAGNGGDGKGFQEGISYTLNTADRHAVVSYASQSYTEWKEGEPMATLRASGGSNGGGSENLATYSGNTVRRLTPLECERLQGLPDGYTDIEFNGKPAPDSRRYKAIGNGMAQPCADFVIMRIAEVVSNEA